MNSHPAPNALYILQAHDGFVSSCRPAHKDLQREVLRLNLALPVKVFYWTKYAREDEVHGPVRGWKLVEEFSWT